MKKPFVTKEKLEEIVKEYPTPFHLYDEKGIRDNVKELLKNSPELAKEVEEQVYENMGKLYGKPAKNGGAKPVESIPASAAEEKPVQTRAAARSSIDITVDDE